MRLARLLSVLAVPALLLAGCSSGSDEVAPTSTDGQLVRAAVAEPVTHSAARLPRPARRHRRRRHPRRPPTR